MKKYIYQKFLLNCDYEDVNLYQLEYYDGNLDLISSYGTERNLLDYNCPVNRKITLEQLDDIIDTEEDWNEFISSLDEVDLLILENGAGLSSNPIIRSYRLATLKAYVMRLKEKNIKFLIAGDKILS